MTHTHTYIDTGCNAPSRLDVMILMDSSGSLKDDDGGYTNWESQLSFAESFVENELIPSDTRFGLILFSGCRSSYTFQGCKEYQVVGRLIKHFGLTAYGSNCNHSQTADVIGAMGEDDFLGGFTRF